MAFTRAQSTSTFTVIGSTAVLNSSSGGLGVMTVGHLMYICATVNVSSVSSPTCKDEQGNNYLLVGTVVDANDNDTGMHFKGIVGQALASTITLAASNSASTWSWKPMAVEYGGASASLDGAGAHIEQALAATSTGSVNLTGLQAGDLIVGSFFDTGLGLGTYTAGAAYAQVIGGLTSGELVEDLLAGSGAGTTVVDASLSHSSIQIAMAIALLPAGASSAPYINPYPQVIAQ